MTAAPQTVEQITPWLEGLAEEGRGPTESELQVVRQVVRAIVDDPLQLQLASLGLLHAGFAERQRSILAAQQRDHELRKQRLDLVRSVWEASRARALSGVFVGALIVTLSMLAAPVVIFFDWLLPIDLQALLEALLGGLS